MGTLASTGPTVTSVSPERRRGSIGGVPPATPDDGSDLVDRHLAAMPEPQRSTLIQLRALLHRLVPDGVDAMKYGMPALLLDGAGVAGYESFRAHCGYYPFSGTVLGTAGDAVSGYTTSKGALRVALDERFPAELVRLLVRLRLDELGRADALAPDPS
jgi:uncharacterized protein YdhG (YjbR/CyaY superfamily)